MYCWKDVYFIKILVSPCRLHFHGASERIIFLTLQWRHNGRNSVSNHQPHNCLLKRLFRRRSKEISKLRVTGFCAGKSPVSGEFPAQKASNAGNVSIWWRHHFNIPTSHAPVLLNIMELTSINRREELQINNNKLQISSIFIKYMS